MVDIGGLGDKAKDFAGENSDKFDQGIEKAGDAVDDRTGGEHAEHVDKAQDALRDKFGGNNE